VSPHKADIGRYDFEYEDDDEEQSGDVDIENKYYNAKQLKTEDPESAIDEFLGVPALEEEKGDWYALCSWELACADGRQGLQRA
jgi:hypothetical protein